MSATCDNSITIKNIIKLANDLLQICEAPQSSENVPSRITSLSQLNSHVIVFMYENICNTQLIDKKSCINSLEDEIHNVQAVIDSLSLDVLHEDLSHLTGEAICGVARISINTDYSEIDNEKEAELKRIEPDLVSIEYLLDILKCIHEWITSRLESTTDGSCKDDVTIKKSSDLKEQYVQEDNHLGCNHEMSNVNDEINNNYDAIDINNKGVNTTSKWLSFMFKIN